MPELKQPILADVCQHHILLVSGPGFAVAVLIRKVGNLLQLEVGDIPRGRTGLLECQGHNGVAGLFVTVDVVGQPLVELTVLKALRCQQVGGIVQCIIGRLSKVALEFGHHLRCQP